MLKEKITVGEAVALINNSIMDFQDGLSPETISKLIYSINNEIQIRDYLLGLPNVYSLETCKSFLSYVGASVDESESYSILTILSAYFYEQNEIELCALSLATALEIKPDYSLAKLLDRVYEAGWSADSFVKMRNELHETVVGTLEEMSEELI
jgi:hypothetical protein